MVTENFARVKDLPEGTWFIGIMNNALPVSAQRYDEMMIVIAHGFSSYEEAVNYNQIHFIDKGLDIYIGSKDTAANKRAKFGRQFKLFLDEKNERREALVDALWCTYNRNDYSASVTLTNLIQSFRAWDWESED